MAGHMIKLKSGYAVRFDLGRDPVSGERKQEYASGFRTKKEAEQYVAEQQSLHDKGLLVQSTQMTFGSYLEYWLANHVRQNLTPKTAEGYASLINAHVKPALGSVRLDKLTPLLIQDYYTSMLEEGLSARTVKNHHRVICRALNDAVKWQLVYRNVTQAVNPPKPLRFQITVLDSHQIPVLLNVLRDTQYYMIVLTAVHTGMRRGELLGLKWAEVDFENGVLRVTRSLNYVTGMGNVLRETKYDRPRAVAMTAQSMNALREHKKQQDSAKGELKTLYTDNDFVFAQTNGKPLLASELTRVFNKKISNTDLPKIRFHDLRHTHATLLLKKGVHPKIVSERLGHSSIAITLDIYSHVLPNLQFEAVQKLEEELKFIEIT